MVHKNYKWNISKEKGQNLIFKNIELILKEKREEIMEIDELLTILNMRTRNIDILNNNKKKNIINYIKIVFGGIVNFIDSYEDFLYFKKEKKEFVKLNKLELSEWIIVE
jgi:hypothetical protein